MTLQIRPVKASDYEAICDVWAAAGLSTRPQGRDAEPEFRKQLAAFPTTYLLAEIGGFVVGVIFGTHDQRKGWINRLAVRPEYRRQGVARRLIEACEQALYAQGLGITAALIEKENAASMTFFTDAGYVADVPVHYFVKRTRPGI